MSSSRRDVASTQRVHRALASPVRTRLLELLRAEPGVDAATLATGLGLHVNTVRTHLGVLEEAGLVEPVTEQRDRPGRPRVLYQPTAGGDAPGAPGEDGYRFLAEILASYLGASSADAAAEAERAGAAWGGFVVDQPAPFARVDADGTIDALVAMLGARGFAPDVDRADPDRPRVVLRRCPFLAVAREHQAVVCSVHLGLMRGALAKLGGDVEAEDLIPWATPDTCISHLRVATP